VEEGEISLQDFAIKYDNLLIIRKGGSYLITANSFSRPNEQEAVKHIKQIKNLKYSLKASK
jgi:hypothetical protein